MNKKWIIRIIIVLASCLIFLLGSAHRDYAIAAGDGNEKIETTLVDQISSDGSADFIIRFTEQADLSAAYSMGWEERGEFVYNTLRETAGRSQVNAKATLDAQGLAYQTFIAGNELYVWGKQAVATKGAEAVIELATLNQLAAMPEVSSIRATRTYTIDPVVEVKPFENISWAGDYLASKMETTVYTSTIAALDWGITDTKADQFWTTFGIRGEGIVVANIDTGVQWDHPALMQEFNCGTNPADPKCWRDPSNICGAGGACDNNGHGTHTMGTMVGDDDPSLLHNVGMAPNAKWIACKGCESSSCSDAALNTCADWILAPGGSAANRPNVVNNSWGDVGGNTWYQVKVQAWKAAGIFPAFSAGNTSPPPAPCGSIGSPGDYQESFGSAAHDSSRNIANFSNRGPSVFGHSPYTKPNISAPGVSICSSVPTDSWNCGYSGTSMASPHTAGAVALLWSLNPVLVGKVDMTFLLLQNHADTPPAGNCGAPADGQGNYTFGYGYLDVLSAGIAASNVKPFYLPIVMRRNINNTPTDILLSNSSIMENQPINTLVGSLSTSDPDLGNAFTYSLVSGTGDTNNGSFNISGNQLRSSEVFNYATKNSYSIRVRTTDQGGLPFEKVFVITITANPIANGDFEQGRVAWTEHSNYDYQLISQSADLLVPPYDGSWAVWLGGADNENSYIQQQVTVPTGSPYLFYWHWIGSAETDCIYDFGEVLVNDVVVEKYYLCSSIDTHGWVKKVVNLSAYAGQSVSLKIGAETDGSVNSNLFVDHVAFQSTLTSESSSPIPLTGIDASIPKTEILGK